MGKWGKRPGLRPIHAVSPAAACSPATSSFCHHYYRHHIVPPLSLTSSHPLSPSHAYTRACALRMFYLHLSLPSFSPHHICIVYFFYFSLLFSRSVSSIILYLSPSRTHARTRALARARLRLHFVSRARFYSFVSYEKFSKPNTQQFFFFLLLFIIIIFLSYI